MSLVWLAVPSASRSLPVGMGAGARDPARPGRRAAGAPPAPSSARRARSSCAGSRHRRRAEPGSPYIADRQPGVEPCFRAAFGLRHVAQGHRGRDRRYACCLAERALAEAVVAGSWDGAHSAGFRHRRAIAATAAITRPRQPLTCVVLLIAHLLHPAHVLPVRRAGDREMRHRRGRRRAVPVLDARRAPRRRHRGGRSARACPIPASGRRRSARRAAGPPDACAKPTGRQARRLPAARRIDLAVGGQTGSTRTRPVKNSAGPATEAWSRE